MKEYRGENNNFRTFDREIIINLIKTYNPCISHYRRHNAPNILYLPKELTIKAVSGGQTPPPNFFSAILCGSKITISI